MASVEIVAAGLLGATVMSLLGAAWVLSKTYPVVVPDDFYDETITSSDKEGEETQNAPSGEEEVASTPSDDTKQIKNINELRLRVKDKRYALDVSVGGPVWEIFYDDLFFSPPSKTKEEQKMRKSYASDFNAIANYIDDYEEKLKFSTKLLRQWLIDRQKLDNTFLYDVIEKYGVEI